METKKRVCSLCGTRFGEDVKVCPTDGNPIISVLTQPKKVGSSELVRTCDCEICKLSTVIQRIASKCDENEKGALDQLWMRMEEAETFRDWTEAEAKDGEILHIAGRVYVPAERARPNVRVSDEQE